MDDSKIEALLLQLGELYHGLERDVADLKASLAVLKAIVASQLNPDDPAAGIEHIRSFEKVAQASDPDATKRRELSDELEAVKLIRKHGTHET